MEILGQELVLCLQAEVLLLETPVLLLPALS